MGFYDLSVTARDGSQISMADYKGKVVLVVNTATGCGFTPHYEPLEAMYEKYHDQGFEIIGLTCDIVYPGGRFDEEALIDAQEIVAELDVDYPVVVATDELNEYINADYIPVTFFVDSHGEQIGDELVGSHSRSEWEETIRDLLD